MKKAAHSKLKPSERPQWLNIYGLLALLAFWQWADLSFSYWHQPLFWLVLLCGSLFVLAFAMFQYGEARFGKDFFTRKARGIWPSRYTGVTFGMLALCGYPIVQIRYGSMSSAWGIALFCLCAVLALINAFIDHNQFTKPC